MATIQDVRAALNRDEPDYQQAKLLGTAALPALRQLIGGNDPMLASKATHLAALIGGQDAAEIVLAAARHPSVIVRVAAAYAAPLLAGETAERVLRELAEDNERAVVTAVRRSRSAMAKTDPKDRGSGY